MIRLMGAMGLAVLVASSAAAQTLSAVEAEEMVRLTWFEGIPADEARQIGPAAADQLVAMLNDPAEAAHHANILVALGHAAQPGAFEAIDAWARTPRAGEVDRATFRAWQALPFAWGHLAAEDPRALARLNATLNAGQPPAWHFRHHTGARLRDLERRAAATALAATGLPAAAGALQPGRSNDPAFEAHLAEMRALHAERAAAGVR